MSSSRKMPPSEDRSAFMDHLVNLVSGLTSRPFKALKMNYIQIAFSVAEEAETEL